MDGRHVGQEHLWRSRVHALRLVLQVPVVLAGGDHMDYHTQGITQSSLQQHGGKAGMAGAW